MENTSENNEIKLETGDTMIVMDDLYYTVSGAAKMMGIGLTKLSKEVNNGNIEVFFHPVRNLFSKKAIQDWIASKTIKSKTKKKREA